MVARDVACEDWVNLVTKCVKVVIREPSASVGELDFGLIAALAAGLGAIAAAIVATVNLRIDYVARRDERVSELVAHFMSPEVANARDIVTSRESKFHTDDSRRAVFLLLWTIERVGADLDALRPSWATKIAYSHGRQPRQASGVEVLYANLARVTRSLNRYFRSDAANHYFDGSIRTANRVLLSLPDWHAMSPEAFKTRIISASPQEDFRSRHVYLLVPPSNEFRPPWGTGGTNGFQRVGRAFRAWRNRVSRAVAANDDKTAGRG